MVILLRVSLYHFMFMSEGLRFVSFNTKTPLLTTTDRHFCGYRPFASLVSNVACGILNLVFIVLVEKSYENLAKKMTRWGLYLCDLSIVQKTLSKHVFQFQEMHRTETEYEESLTVKLFVISAFNYYAHAFYTAFLKGRWVSSVPWPLKTWQNLTQNAFERLKLTIGKKISLNETVCCNFG